MSLTINGSAVQPPNDPRVSLLDLLREHLDLHGTKKGCNQGACGACTVLVDGERIVSCLALAVQYEGRVTSLPSRASAGDGTGCIRCSRPSSSMTASSAAIVLPARSARRWRMAVGAGARRAERGHHRPDHGDDRPRAARNCASA